MFKDTTVFKPFSDSWLVDTVYCYVKHPIKPSINKIIKQISMLKLLEQDSDFTSLFTFSSSPKREYEMEISDFITKLSIPIVYLYGTIAHILKNENNNNSFYRRWIEYRKNKGFVLSKILVN
jgi:hypothetical protein